MSQQFVTILMPNGHREKVKVTPATILQPMFADLLKKHQFSSNNYSLKTSTGKPLDVSVPFRLTGISNRATLESCTKIVPPGEDKTSVVHVAVQMPNGTREFVDIDDDNALWDIIENLNDKFPSLLDDDDLEPCLSFMGHSFRGPEVLLEKTLRDCGLSGRPLLRLSFVSRFPVDSNSGLWEKDLDFRSVQNSVLVLDSKASTKLSGDESEGGSVIPEEQTSDASTVTNNLPSDNRNFITSSRGLSLPDQIQPFTWIPENVTNNLLDSNDQIQVNSANEVFVNNRFANFKFPEQSKTSAVESDQDSSKQSSSESTLTDREMKVFSLSDISTSLEEVPDSFFDVTVEDLKVMQKLRQKEIKAMSDQPLMTEESKKRKLMSKYSSVTILRFMFPDRMVVQAKFILKETSESLYKEVESLLVNDISKKLDFKFHLFTTPPKSIIKRDDKTLLELGLFPAVNIHMSFGNQSFGAYLKPEILAKQEPPEIMLSSSCTASDSVRNGDNRNVTDMVTPLNTEDISSLPTSSKSGDPNSRGNGTGNRTASKNVPRWFTAGFKK